MVPSNTRDPQFKSSPRQIVFAINCIEKKGKESPGMTHLKNIQLVVEQSIVNKNKLIFTPIQMKIQSYCLEFPRLLLRESIIEIVVHTESIIEKSQD